MSTEQLQLQSGLWSDTFPENLVTQLQSTVFVKKLLAIAVSNIAYMRVVYPEKAFTDRCLENLNIKILKNDKSADKSAAQVVDWLRGVFDAIDKKYLRLLILGLYRSSSDPDLLMEMYTFKFSYTNTTEMEIYSSGKKISSTASQTKKATISLLRNLVELINTLKPLPDNVRITMKLFYYDDVTPADYEPPGFGAAEADFVRMEGNPIKFRFPSVSTAFHSLQLRVIAETMVTTEDEEPASGRGDQPMTEEVLSGIIPSGMDIELVDAGSQLECVADSTTGPPEENSRAEHCSQLSAVAGHHGISQTEQEYSDVEPLGIRCPCLANEDDGLMILCSVCHYWQHAICFKIVDEGVAPEYHVCNLCYSASAQPTDPELAECNESEAQMMCLWRRCLSACLEGNLISSARLASRLGVANSVASRLIDRLVSEGYATSNSRLSTATKNIHKRKIKGEAVVKYISKSMTAMEIE